MGAAMTTETVNAMDAMDSQDARRRILMMSKKERNTKGRKVSWQVRCERVEVSEEEERGGESKGRKFADRRMGRKGPRTAQSLREALLQEPRGDSMTGDS